MRDTCTLFLSHKRCGSSHLMSHKSGKRVRRLRKKSTLNVSAENRRIRNAMLTRQSTNPLAVEAAKQAALAANAESTEAATAAVASDEGTGSAGA